jgi:NADP-dependent 3-hydroxy acid dehydrogenase YdfG
MAFEVGAVMVAHDPPDIEGATRFLAELCLGGIERLARATGRGTRRSRASLGSGPRTKQGPEVMKQLQQRVAVVTGAASGIGRATAIALAKQGCRLALCDIDDQGLAETKRSIEALGQRVTAHHVDVADKTRMERFAAEVVDAHGGANILVNNAGVSVASSFADQSLEDFEWLMGINFWGVVYGSKFFLPTLRAADEAHIVNISSVFGLVGIPLQSSYCASKFAVRGFSESLRAELASTTVGVTSVHPGGVATNIAASARTNGDPKSTKMKARTVAAFRSMLPPEKAAAAIVRGIRANRARVLIARESSAIDWAKRVAPVGTSALVHWGYRRAYLAEGS